MNILDICDNADIMSILRIVKIVITIIRIVVPLILIISLSINYTSAVKSNDSDLLSKANKSAIPKIIAAILVFLIPTFVHILGNNSAYEKVAREKINKAKESLELSDYQVAISEVNKIKDKDIKSALMTELNKINEYVSLNQEIGALKINYSKNKYKDIFDRINNISDTKVKEKFLKKLEELGINRPLNANSGAERGSYNGVDYIQILPPNPTTNLPLIVFLHGDGELGNVESIRTLPIYSYVNNKDAFAAGDFIFLAPSRPTRGYATSENITKTKSVIDYIADKYEVDMDKISITGFSGGSILTWGMVSSYPDFFSCAVPVSCGQVGAKAGNFKTTPVYSMSGTVGVENSYTNYLLNEGTNKICKKIGEEATETVIAALSEGKDELVGEISDLTYHILVLMYNKQVTLEDVKLKLEERFKIKGNKKQFNKRGNY